MKNIQLPLIKNWFDLTKEGVKPEDYRAITPYWCSRFLLWRGSKVSQRLWSNRLDDYLDMSDAGSLAQYIASGDATINEFSQNIMTLGYPKKNDTERILILKHEGIEIREGNPEWGAEEGVIYFVIKHGKILNKQKP